METGLWKQFDRIVVFDTETTGIEFGRDEIIELGAAAFSAEGETDCMDLLLRLSPGRTLPPLSPSSPASRKSSWNRRAWRKPTPVRRSATCWAGRADAAGGLQRPVRSELPLSFPAALRAGGCPAGTPVSGCPHGVPGPAGLPSQAQRCHHSLRIGGSGGEQPPAVDDARAAAVLLEAMAAERDDLDRYVDLFGYSPKYGVSGRRIASVEYRPQPYQRVRPLYEVTETL